MKLIYTYPVIRPIILKTEITTTEPARDIFRSRRQINRDARSTEGTRPVEVRDYFGNIVDYFTSFLSTGENEIITNIPRNHRTYAELIDKTYQGSRENVKGYNYIKSLNIENTLYKPLLALGLSGIAERFLPSAFTQLVRQRVGEVRPRREFGGFLEVQI